jgi:putative signal transducing protein
MAAGKPRMILFYTARQRFDAYLLADRLKQAGIRAHVFNEHAASIVGDVPPDVAQPQVWLEREQDRERATIVLERMNADARKVGVVTCPACREESPANFDLCWNCGGSL